MRAVVIRDEIARTVRVTGTYVTRGAFRKVVMTVDIADYLKLVLFDFLRLLLVHVLVLLVAELLACES